MAWVSGILCLIFCSAVAFKSQKLEAAFKETRDALLPPILQATLCGDAEEVERLIRVGVDVDASDANGINSLHISALCGYEELLALLLVAGADVNKQTKTGETALHIATGASSTINMFVCLRLAASCKNYSYYQILSN